MTAKQKQYTLDEIAELAKALNIAQKNDPASTSLAGTTTLHGPQAGGSSTTQFGLFSQPGVRPEMFSTFVRPSSIFSTIVRMGGLNRSEYTDQILEVFTGVLEAAGTNATDFCGDPPSTPSGKVCEQIYKFGSFYAKTELNALPLMGQRRNRADVPRNILNWPASDLPLIPEIMFQALAANMTQLGYELFKLGVAAERSFEQVLWNGNASLNSTQTDWGWIQEFRGLASQITTGYVDAVSGEACPSMDSTVITFDGDIGATAAGGDARNMVQMVSDLVWRQRMTAQKQGMAGVVWALSMREEMFRPLVESYACNYATYRCNDTDQGHTLNQDATTTNALRLEMLNGQYLLVDGLRVPVVFSEGIPQTTVSANTYSSDLFLVPLSWSGIPLLHIEYFDMDNRDISEWRQFGGLDTTATLNNGLWLAGKRSTGLCEEFHFAHRARLILEAPWLAGRIDSISYSFANLPAMAYPGSSGYVNGGSTYRA